MFEPQICAIAEPETQEADEATPATGFALPEESAPATFWVKRISAIQWHRVDWAPDLAEEIGSRRWLRGFATLGGLMLAALAFWPNFELQAANSVYGDNAVRDEYRSQMIMPLSLGGESGRHMGAGVAVAALSSAPERSRVALTAFVAAGDSFMRLLERAGVSSDDAARAAGMVAARVPLGEIAPGTRVNIVLGDRPADGAPRRLQSVDLRARFDMNISLARSGGDFALSTRAIAIDNTPLRIRGIVGPSLYRSARAAGAPAGAIQQYLQALDAHLSLEGDIQPGDSFDMIMNYKRAGSGEGQPGDVLYAGLDRAGSPVTELMRWGNGKDFFAADALTRPVVTVQSSGMMMPVAGHITSNFGMRFHPVLGYTRMHAGVDIGASWGSPIHASADGVVSFAGRHGGHGNYVRLEHGAGLGTGYGHMSTIVVRSGERVREGQVIGYVGSTGLSTGPHLHYEMYDHGRTINPLGAHMAASSSVVQQVDPKQVAAFKAKLEQLKKIRPGAALGTVAMARGGNALLR
ncbi:MAG: M23 family metallopeptidase [Novosphingobium sp.]